MNDPLTTHEASRTLSPCGAIAGEAALVEGGARSEDGSVSLAEHTRLARMSADISFALTQSHSLKDMLQRCAAVLAGHPDTAFARIWTLEPETDVLELQASAGLYTHLDGPHGRVPVGQYKIGLIAQERRAHITNQVIGDERVADQEWARRERMVAFAGYPLLIGDRVVGVMALFARSPLSDALLQSLASIADVISLGIERKQSEGKTRFQAELLDTIGQAVIATDCQGTIIYWNRFAEVLYGWTSQEAVGRDQVDLIRAEATPQLRAEIIARAQTGQSWSGEAIMRRRDGTIFPAQVTNQPIFDADGKPAGIIGISIDVSDQRRIEESLRESETRFRLVTEAIPQQVWTAQPDGALDYVNQRVLEYFGRTNDEMIGWGWADVVHPDDISEALARWSHSLATGDLYEVEFRLKRSSDNSYRWNLARALPLRDAEGHIVKWFGTNTDITERKQAEESLRGSEALKTAIVETALDCIISMDHESRIIEWNPAAEDTFGYSREQALGQRLGELIVPAALREKHYQGIERYLATGEGPILGNRIEVPALRADGSEILVELAVNAISISGTPVFTAYVRDITARKQSEELLTTAKEEAERANRAKSEFMSRMSHELRTPMNAILGFGQLLEMDELNTEQNQAVEQILKGGRHLLGLINEVLDIARIEAEQMPLDLEPVPVAETVSAALALVHPLAAPRNIELHDNSGTAQGLFVLADLRRFNQILLNLLSNAVKYNRDGGSVSITCEPLSETRLRIAFTDTGTGISPERLERLFTPFERLGADETGVEGTGLGLALSKRLVEAMGGIIAVSSTVGEGSMFAIEMPLTEPQEAALPRDAQDVFLPLPELLNAGETQSVVLYIEDNLSNYDLVQNILRHRPEIKLLAAMQGKVGLELAERHNPDLILLDYHLPDINGDEVLVTLREASETRDIPVVVLSADATPQQIERMTAAGATDYLTKPVDVKRFLAVLDRELGRTERAREGEHKHLMMPERGVGNSGQ